ncbi:MAG: hypothetical protein SFZ03_02360 [Candidatus Melainabacteria bacterium]|nr:hypothetical protein [Candidatus Melainabacteria bacterium]
MTWLFNSTFWIILLGLTLVARQLLFVLSAENGRKKDLVKRLYRDNHPFTLAVLIPYTVSGRLAPLLELLNAIQGQDYPHERVTIHIVTTQETMGELQPDRLANNVRLWAYPEFRGTTGQAMEWLVERLLAAGGAGLFVFLKPTDIIKPDYFQSVVSRSFEHSVIQGYLAFKHPPQSLLTQCSTLSTRLCNRLHNAGRYHLGLGCQLQPSGWAATSQVLEMVPYKASAQLNHLEYTLRLQLAGIRVAWAPNVVVFQDEPLHFTQLCEQVAEKLQTRLHCLTRYSLPFIFQALTARRLGALDQLTDLLSPSTFWVGVLLLGLAWMDANAVLETLTAQRFELPANPAWWLSFLGMTLAIHVFGLMVARCRRDDYWTTLTLTPVVSMAVVAVLPWFFVSSLVKTLFQPSAMRRSRHKNTPGVGKRFNEELEPEFYHLPSLNIVENWEQALTEAEAQMSTSSSSRDYRASSAETPLNRTLDRTAGDIATDEDSLADLSNRSALERVKQVPLTNGDRQVMCTLRTLTNYSTAGEELHQMSLEYKNHAFHTAAYRILDQAFYELHAKLKARGLTIVTCGSCGQFYNPTADIPGALKVSLKNAGVCLFGKVGREVDLTVDAVTVISSACQHHCPIDQREANVRRWQESLYAIQS